MNRLHREVAPMSDAAWDAVDEEARGVLRSLLTARHFADVRGPDGWDLASIPTGHTREHAADLGDDLRLLVRDVRPVMEVRTELVLARADLDVVDRGGQPELDAVVDAARRAALAEDRAVFHGAGNLSGITTAPEHAPVPIPADASEYPGAVADAVERLRDAGIDGPYGIALGPRCWNDVYRATEAGFPVIRHLRELLAGPILRAPGVDGAVVLSVRGGDVEIVLGADWALGYVSHDDRSVRLFLEESIAWRVVEPAAAVALTHF